MPEQPINRNSFIFYRSFYEAITELPDEEKGRIYDAIFKYALDGECASLSGVEKAIFTLIKPQIDANQKKYENGKKGAEYGALGGRPRKENNPEITPGKPLENPEQTPNVNVNVNVNENGNEKYPSDFELFWGEYPRRIDKRGAYLKFKTALKSITLFTNVSTSIYHI